MNKHFKTTILDQYLSKKRREQEWTRQKTVRRALRLLPSLSRKYGFQRAYLFGSLTNAGHFRDDSDIDVAIAGLKSDKYFAFMAELSEKLGREVDIVQIERHRFRKRIEESGIRWEKKN
jgi:predicted nucleotidyltransferase